MKWLLAVIMAAHGSIHLMGFAKAFGRDVPALHHAIGRPAGLLWLLAALLLLTGALLLVAGSSPWWIAAGAGVLSSQSLIQSAWGDARFGTIANLLILAPVIVAGARRAPGGFRAIYRRETETGFRRFTPSGLVTEEDLAPLPAPVQKYLRYVGVVGKSRVVNFRVRWRGTIRRSAAGRSMPFTADQANFYDEPARAFLIESTLFGIPFEGLHLYLGALATMRVKVASLLPVADVGGPEMDQSETVTMFNDQCLLAPATLIDPRIRWEERGPLSTAATFTNAGHPIRAILTFNDAGQLVNFDSDDRYMAGDGKSNRLVHWSTPVSEYGTFAGLRLFARGEAVWNAPEGRFAYGQFELVSIEYNVTGR